MEKLGAKAGGDFAEYEQERGRSRGMFRSSRLFPCDRQKFKQDEKAKSLALRTHLRGGIYATQMEEFCWTLLFRRSFFRTADGAVSKGGGLWSPFFRPFFVKRQRKGIFAFTERAQLDGVEVGCARPKEKLLKV